MTNLKLFANCIPVKGANRSVICDLQKKDVFFIPNDLYDILTLKGKSVNDIKLKFENKYDDIIDEYFNFLIKNNLGFYTDTPELFPDLNLEWNYPFEISNAIIDFDKESQYNIFSVLSQLNEINCKHLQIRFYNTVSKELIEDILLFLNNLKSIIISIDFILPFHSELNEKELKKLLSDFPRINSLSVFGSVNNQITKPIRDKSGYIIYSKDKINKLSCGIISSEYFVVNMKSFIEGLSKNSCLNGKISIDSNGDIKNCPSMKESFGNIQTINLREAIKSNNFKEKWGITKDDINICKDCEFRYVCTDCRAFLENPDNKLSKPLKCGYNPYTNEWNEWSLNPLKQSAINFYGIKQSS